MSAVARLLHGRHVPVSGCDAQATGPAQRLREEGIPVRLGHDVSHVDDVDTVVVSSAVRDDNANRWRKTIRLSESSPTPTQ